MDSTERLSRIRLVLTQLNKMLGEDFGQDATKLPTWKYRRILAHLIDVRSTITEPDDED